MAYDDYQNKSSLSMTADGPQLTRTIYIRAETEVDVLDDPLCPAHGDSETVDGIPIYCQSRQISAVEGAAAEDGDFLYAVTATWTPLSSDNPTAGKASWNVSFRPQSLLFKNVKAASDQVHYPASNPDWPEVTTGINQTEEGIQGVEIDEMVEVLTLNFFKAPADVETYLTAIRAIAGLVNSDAFTGPWGTYAIGEARITGVGVGKTNGEVATVIVEVSRSKNVTAVPIYLDSKAGTENVDKKGWQYLWVRYLKGNKAGDTDVKPMSIDAHVATVYDSASFSPLGVTSGIWT